MIRPALNALGRYGNGEWLPMSVESDGRGKLFFRDPAGLAIVMPDEWYTASRQEIDDEMKRHSSVLVRGFR